MGAVVGSAEDIGVHTAAAQDLRETLSVAEGVEVVSRAWPSTELRAEIAQTEQILPDVAFAVGIIHVWL